MAPRARLVVLGLAIGLVISACTPEEIAWWTARRDEAVAEQRPCPDLAGHLAANGLPPHFHLVAWRESRCQPTAISPTGDWGVLQVHASTWLASLCAAGIACTRDELLDPSLNIEAAAFIFAVQGWDAWSATA